MPSIRVQCLVDFHAGMDAGGDEMYKDQDQTSIRVLSSDRDSGRQAIRHQYRINLPSQAPFASMAPSARSTDTWPSRIFAFFFGSMTRMHSRRLPSHCAVLPSSNGFSQPCRLPAPVRDSTRINGKRSRATDVAGFGCNCRTFGFRKM
jgi:hypothetical protein